MSLCKGLGIGALAGMLALLSGSFYLCREGEQRKMVAYMEQKYGESFSVIEPCGGQLGKDYTMLRMRSNDRNQEGILVRASGKEETVYQDNYLAYLLKEKIVQQLTKPAREAFGECKVFYRIPESVFPAEFPAHMEADAFLRHPLARVRVYIYVRNHPCLPDIKGRVDDFFSMLQSRGYIVGGVISFPRDVGMYEIITEENFRGDVYQGYQSMAEAVFSMDENGDVMYLEWKGEIQHE